MRQVYNIVQFVAVCAVVAVLYWEWTQVPSESTQPIEESQPESFVWEIDRNDPWFGIVDAPEFVLEDHDPPLHIRVNQRFGKLRAWAKDPVTGCWDEVPLKEIRPSRPADASIPDNTPERFGDVIPQSPLFKPADALQPAKPIRKFAPRPTNPGKFDARLFVPSGSGEAMAAVAEQAFSGGPNIEFFPMRTDLVADPANNLK